MKVITNLNSVISLFLCEGHCSFKVLIFFFAIFATVRRKVSKMRSSIYSKIDLGASKSKSIPQKQDFYGTVKHDIHVISFMPNYTFMRVKSLDLRCYMHPVSDDTVKMVKRFHCMFFKCLLTLKNSKYSLEFRTWQMYWPKEKLDISDAQMGLIPAFSSGVCWYIYYATEAKLLCLRNTCTHVHLVCLSDSVLITICHWNNWFIKAIMSKMRKHEIICIYCRIDIWTNSRFY